MKIEQSTAKTLVIKEVANLDPVTVYLEEFSQDAGRIVINCWGKAWSAFWGAMGGRGIAQFFVESNNSYLAGNLDSQLKSEVYDSDAFYDLLVNKVKDKLDTPLDEDEEYYFENALSDLESDGTISSDQKEGEFWCHDNSELLSNVFGYEWWYDIPMMTNPDYAYLCRIIDAVRDGLTQMLKEAECVSYSESYACNDCGCHDVGVNDDGESFCFNCASLNIIIE